MAELNTAVRGIKVTVFGSDYSSDESVGKYDSICGNCSVEHFNEEGEENDDRECS